jgi:UDP-N-acetylglucosamine 2-epimerase (non-hydrolysing)/GDP/UDP-N,N'-diacetylbacillosamine 2-epimerase (hydrolysing)
MIKIACIGNSSSGLKETPAFKCPTVNIGSRQEGRLRGENVLNVDYKSSQITDAVKRCLFNETFRQQCQNAPNPYWLGDAGPKIAEVLATVPLGKSILRKRMTLKGNVCDGWFR